MFLFFTAENREISGLGFMMDWLSGRSILKLMVEQIRHERRKLRLPFPLYGTLCVLRWNHFGRRVSRPWRRDPLNHFKGRNALVCDNISSRATAVLSNKNKINHYP